MMVTTCIRPRVASTKTHTDTPRLAWAVFGPLVALVAGGCHQVVGIRERCADGCLDERTRAICGEDGRIRGEACPASAPFCGGGACVACRSDDDCASGTLEGACERSTCDPARGCGTIPRTGEACGADATCRGYACVGPDTTVAASQNTSCARASDGLVWCWGDGTMGQLGDGRMLARSTPYPVPRIGAELGRARAVSVGYGHACAVLDDGKVVCWGNNLAAQSNGKAPSPTTAPVGPTQIDGVPPAASVVAGYGHTCALTRDGRVFCWGHNLYGECGVGSEEPFVVTPTEVVGMGQVSGLTTAKTTTCATNRTDVFCWGDNTWGQLGPDVSARAASSPVRVGGIESGGVLQVAASWGHVCAIVTSSNYVQCWGNNRWGQLGDGTVYASWGEGSPGDRAHPVPRRVVYGGRPGTPLSSVSLVAAGTGSHVCARTPLFPADFLCWGENGDAEVGVLRPDPVLLPTRVPFAHDAIQIATGDDHTCVVRAEADGFDVSCWGEAASGQVGDGVPVAAHKQLEPGRVRWPDAPGGVGALRAQ